MPSSFFPSTIRSPTNNNNNNNNNKAKTTKQRSGMNSHPSSVQTNLGTVGTLGNSGTELNPQGTVRPVQPRTIRSFFSRKGEGSTRGTLGWGSGSGAGAGAGAGAGRDREREIDAFGRMRYSTSSSQGGKEGGSEERGTSGVRMEEGRTSSTPHASSVLTVGRGALGNTPQDPSASSSTSVSASASTAAVGTIRFPTTARKVWGKKKPGPSALISSGGSQTDFTDPSTPTPPASAHTTGTGTGTGTEPGPTSTPTSTTVRKKKNSLSLFLSATKARATISSSQMAKLAREGEGGSGLALGLGQERGGAKVRVTSDPVVQVLDTMSGKEGEAIPIRRTRTVWTGKTGVAPDLGHEQRRMGRKKEVGNDLELNRMGGGVGSPTTSTTVIKSPTGSRFSGRQLDQGTSRLTQGTSRSVQPRPGLPKQTPTIGPRSTSRILPSQPIRTDSGFSIKQDPGPNHFVLRLAVTYLTKTILPELRSSRNEFPMQTGERGRYRKGLIELLRPLERMERSWGIEWMLRGKEGFAVSSRTKEKERDCLRMALGDGELLFFLTDRHAQEILPTVRLRFEQAARNCRRLQLPLDDEVDFDDLPRMDGTEIYLAATVIVALARHAGPASKHKESSEEDDNNDLEVRSRSPSIDEAPARRKDNVPSQTRPENQSDVKRFSAPVPTGSNDKLARELQRQPVKRLSQPQTMTIRMPAGDYYATNPMHSKLDTVLSMTPGESSYTPTPLDGAKEYFGMTPRTPMTNSARPILHKPSSAYPDVYTPSSQGDISSIGFRYHSRDPTPSLISGTTERTSMALSDLPERGPRSISFVSQDDEPRRKFKASLTGQPENFGTLHQASGSTDAGVDPEAPMVPVSRFRPRVQRGITLASSSSTASLEALERTASRRSIEIKPGRPQYIPRRHTTQSPPKLFQSREPSLNGSRAPSGSYGQPYSPPGTPRRTMSPSFPGESPFMPSSRRTSFTSAASQSPTTKEVVLVVVKNKEGETQTYQLGNCIGKGQFGVVYRALNLSNGQFVAVKRITLENLDEDIDQIMREVEVLKRLKHPSIVRYLGMTKDERYLDIILEYVEGGSLANASRSFGKFSEHLVASYAAKMLEGLHYLHGQDVVHCDLKAANILITKKADVRLSDFGVSLNLRAVENQKDDNVVGTPNWVAPEIISLQGASPASDIWSLGCTIVELLEGKPPWSELDSNMAVLFKIVEEEWPIPTRYSDALQDFLGLCFKKNPLERPTAETLFDHAWIRKEIGIDPRLRNQDSIPFLRRISGDAVRLQQLRYQHMRDASSPIEGNFSDWKMERQRPVVSEGVYAEPTRILLRSNPGSSFSVKSDDTDPGRPRPTEMISAERRRALDKLNGTGEFATGRYSDLTPINRPSAPVRSKERLERLKERDSRRESDSTDSTAKAVKSPTEVEQDPRQKIHSSIRKHEENRRAYETLTARSVVQAQQPEQEDVHTVRGKDPSTNHIPGMPGQLHHESTDSKGDCVIQ